MRPSTSLLALLALTVEASTSTTSTGPFLQSLNETGWVIGNDLWNITIGSIYGKKLYYNGRDLIGNATGHYQGYGMWSIEPKNFGTD